MNKIIKSIINIIRTLIPLRNNRYLTLAALIPLLFALALSPVLFTGCKSPTQHKQTVNTMFTIHTTVDLALDGYYALVIKGVVPTNGVPKVSSAYDKFQEAYSAAVVVVGSNTNALVPQSVADAAKNVSETITAAKGGN